MSDESPLPRRENKRRRRNSSGTMDTIDDDTMEDDPREGGSLDNNTDQPNEAVPADGDTTSTTASTITPQNEKNQQISEYNVPTFRMLRKVIKQATKAQYHYENLQKGIDENRTPKGFNVKRIEFKLPEVSLVNQIKWERAHTNLSIELTKIARDHWKERGEKLRGNFAILKEQLAPQTSKSELKYINSLLDKYEEETVYELLQQTQKKTLQKSKTVAKEKEKSNSNRE